MRGVSIVIPFYGDPKPTLGLIGQLQQQVGNRELQIIVADDASPVPFPAGDGYEVTRRENNGGFGANVNAGSLRARHPALMILNSDLEIEPDTVEQWCAAAQPSWPAVTAPAMMTPEYQAHVAWRFLRVRHLALEWLVAAARLHRTDWFSRAMGHDMAAFHSATPSATDWLVGAALLLPTESFRAVGGFDEDFFMNCEEVDLQRRLRGVGIGAVYLPSVAVRHALGGSSDVAKRARWVTQSRFRYMRKWGGVRRLRVALWVVTGVNLGWRMMKRFRGADVKPWTAFRDELELIEYGWRSSR